MKEIKTSELQQAIQEAARELAYRNPVLEPLAQVHQALAGVMARLASKELQSLLEEQPEVLRDLHQISRRIASEYASDIHDPSAIPPFHLRDGEDEWLAHKDLEIDSEYTLDFDVAQEVALLLATEMGMQVQVCNLYANTILGVDPEG